MLCYRDMTFCPFFEDCANAHDCARPLTEDIIKAAAARHLDIAQFMEKPECHVLIEPEKSS